MSVFFVTSLKTWSRYRVAALAGEARSRPSARSNAANPSNRRGLVFVTSRQSLARNAIVVGIEAVDVAGRAAAVGAEEALRRRVAGEVRAVAVAASCGRRDGWS